MDGMIWVLRPLISIPGSEVMRLVMSESEMPKPRKKSSLGLRVLCTSAQRKRGAAEMRVVIWALERP